MIEGIKVFLWFMLDGLFYICLTYIGMKFLELAQVPSDAARLWGQLFFIVGFLRSSMLHRKDWS